MKGLIIKIVILLVVVWVGVQYLLYLKTGNVPATVSSPLNLFSSKPKPAKLPAFSTVGEPDASKGDKPIYRWRDEHGQLHISELPPINPDKVKMLP